MSGSSVRITWALRVDERDVGSPHDERLGHLEPDVAAADDDHPLAAALLGEGEQLRAVLERLHAPDLIAVGARQIGPGGPCAGADEQVVEADAEGAVVAAVVHLDLTAIEVDPHDLVTDPHVDAVVVAQLIGRAGDERVDVDHVARHEVGDAAGAVAGALAPLEGHDLEVGPQAAGVGGCRHPPGVATDHHESLGHVRRLSTPDPPTDALQLQHWRPWAYARTAGTIRAHGHRRRGGAAVSSASTKRCPSPVPRTASASSRAA